MRILVAGAAGVIGRQLVPRLVAAGHEVSGTTRDPARAAWITDSGAVAFLLDALDGAATARVVGEAQPDVVVHQLTDLAGGFAPEHLQATARLRQVGTRNLVEAMLAAGVRRLVAQSGAWLYADGPLPHVESDPLRDLGSSPSSPVLPGILELERLTLGTPGVDGIVLRYGYFYGPGTAHPERGDVGGGPAVHVAEAARATVLAIERGTSGVYNVVDDGGPVSNDRARAVLGWAPGFPTWPDRPAGESYPSTASR